jgi:hypothetical protein
MPTLGDEMAAAGKPIDDDELLTYILTGLDMEFKPVVTSLLARKESVNVSEAYSQLLAFETRMEIMGSGSSGSSVNSANCDGRGGSGGRGRGNFNRGHGQCGGCGRTSFNQRGNGGGRGNQNCGNSGKSKLTCQVYLEIGHTADKCWHGFEEDYVPVERHAGVAMNTYTSDNNCTLILVRQTTSQEGWRSWSSVKSTMVLIRTTANGAGTNIRHIGHSTIHTLE